MHFPLFLPSKRRTAVLRTLKYKQSTLLLAVSLSFCLHYRGLVFMLFIKKSPFYCLVCISCFLLSRVPHIALESFSSGGFTEGPANGTNHSLPLSYCLSKLPPKRYETSRLHMAPCLFSLYSKSFFQARLHLTQGHHLSFNKSQRTLKSLKYYNLANNKGNQISIDNSPFCRKARACFKLLF